MSLHTVQDLGSTYATSGVLTDGNGIQNVGSGI